MRWGNNPLVDVEFVMLGMLYVVHRRVPKMLLLGNLLDLAGVCDFLSEDIESHFPMIDPLSIHLIKSSLRAFMILKLNEGEAPISAILVLGDLDAKDPPELAKDPDEIILARPKVEVVDKELPKVGRGRMKNGWRVISYDVILPSDKGLHESVIHEFLIM
jgi:hypothetical protein